MHGNPSPFNSFKLPDEPTTTFSNSESLSKSYEAKYSGIFGWGDVALLGDVGEGTLAGGEHSYSFTALQEVSAGSSSPSWATALLGAFPHSLNRLAGR